MENICHVVRATFSLVEKKNGGGRNLEKETYFCIEKNRKGGKYLEKIITFCVELAGRQSRIFWPRPSSYQKLGPQDF